MVTKFYIECRECGHYENEIIEGKKCPECGEIMKITQETIGNECLTWE